MKWSHLFLVIATTFAYSLNDSITNVWRGMVERNDGIPFLIHRPYSEAPGDAVSEGFGYGLIVSLYCNDQHNFNRLIEGAEQTMWNGQYYDWRIDEHGHKIAYGGATDAEQDIIAMLLMAHRLVQSSQWTDYRDGFYLSRARLMLDQFWDQGIDAGIVRPGYRWGGSDFVNAGYFAPAWYRIFAEFDPNHDWHLVIDTSYDILFRSPGIVHGLVPDWMTPHGQYTQNLGYNAYGDGQYMYKDAIRVLWRIGTDLLWNRDDRADRYINLASDFIQTRGGIAAANFYRMDGSLVPADDVWIFDGGNRQRPRREYSPLTIGMWMIPVFLKSSPNERDAALDAFMSFYPTNQTYYGRQDGEETIDHNELYFDQFMALFGALFVSGKWIDHSKIRP